MMMRILSIGLLAIGSLLVFVPHASAYTSCNNDLYNPLNGNPMVTDCYDANYDGYGCSDYSWYVSAPVYVQYEGTHDCSYSDGGACYYEDYYLDYPVNLHEDGTHQCTYYDSNGCYSSDYYYDYPVYLYYDTYTNCNGTGSDCYLGLVYLDTYNVRTGLC